MICHPPPVTSPDDCHPVVGETCNLFDILTSIEASWPRFICHPDTPMTRQPIPDYLTKKEVEEHYGRSHRSLTRDFSAAVRTADQMVLSHLKLQTEDGTVREGSEVTLEEIQKLSNQGLSPTWYVEGEWAAERYGTRAEPMKKDSSGKSEPKGPDDSQEKTQPSGSPDVVRHLEEQIRELRSDKEKLYNELSIKNEQIRQANDRTRESNILMKELQAMLSNVQDRALLPRPLEPRRPVDGDTTIDIIENVDEAEPVATATKVKPSPKQRSTSKKGTASQAKSKTKPQPSSGKTEKPKWYEMPTFGRLISRRQD